MIGETLYDDKVRGLHLRVTAKSRSFFLYYVTRSKIERRPKLGEYPEMTLDRARLIAKGIKDRVAIGEDPGGEWDVEKKVPTLKEVSVMYMEKHGKLKKHADEQQYILNKYVLPKLGIERITKVTHNDIEELHAAMRKTPYMANRTLALLSKLFNLTEKWGHRPLNSNPCKHIERFKEEKRRRYMSAEEAVKIAEALDFYSTLHPQAVALIYLLMFTGARKSEIANAKWEWITDNRLELPDSKTGAKTVFLPPQVVKILDKLPRNTRTITGIAYPQKCWSKVLARAGVTNLRIHDLRHSFASAALASGVSLSQIGELLGHKSSSTTKRYAHLIDDAAHIAAQMAAEKLISMMTPKQEIDILN